MPDFPIVGDEPDEDFSLSTFLGFIGATDKAKHALAARSAQEYSLARDYYGQMREAIRTGRRRGDDRGAMNAVLASCPAGRRRNYAELAGGWLHFVASCGTDTVLDFPVGRWRAAGVRVRVTPDLAIRRTDDSYLAIKLYLRNERPVAREVATTLCLLGSALPRILPGACPALLDVRRCKLFDRMPDLAGFEQFLRRQAAQLAALRAQLSD